MKHEVFILGQTIDQKARRDGREVVERLGSREGIEKETKRRFEEKEGLRDPPLLEFLDPTLQCSQICCFFKSSRYDKVELKNQNLVFTMHCQKMLWCETECKNVPLVKQNVIKFEVFILGRQRIDQKGWGRVRKERIEKGSRERIPMELCDIMLRTNRVRCALNIYSMRAFLE